MVGSDILSRTDTSAGKAEASSLPMPFMTWKRIDNCSVEGNLKAATSKGIEGQKDNCNQCQENNVTDTA